MAGKRADKYAILADIHGNLEALHAVLDDARDRGVTKYVCLGDMVGYNANPAECVDLIRSIATAIVRGNHDHYCSHDESLDNFHPLAANVVDWTRRHLKQDHIDFLSDLPMFRMVSGFTIVHSTLDVPEKWGYVFDCLEADAHFNYQTTSVCFYGHTHVPVCFEKDNRIACFPFTRIKVAIGRKYFINVGSVGQPRDGDPRAAYAIYDMENREIEQRRIAYDIAAAQRKIREARLPDRLAHRLAVGK